jgi:hypothetical protein
MKTEADELSMPGAFRQFHLDCEGKESIKQLCLSIKMAVSELTVWYLFAALLQYPEPKQRRILASMA